MPDTATVIVGAFAGGLAGAILQPVTVYGLDRLRSKDEQRKRKERQLRRMISAWLAFCSEATHLAASVFEQASSAFGGVSIDDFGSRNGISTERLPSWEAERIEDREMRTMATLLHAHTILLVQQMSTESFDNLGATMAAATELRPKIIKKMDDLGWPEVQD
jgi:hypothetical protein